MSRVLKGVVWQDDPHIVEAPKFKRPKEQPEDDAGEMSEGGGYSEAEGR